MKQPARVQIERVTVTASEFLNGAKSYSKALEDTDTARRDALNELSWQKQDLRRPYREEAAEQYVTQKHAPRWEKLNEKATDYNSRLKAHEEAGILTKVGWDLGKSYNKAADELTREGNILKYEQKQLEKSAARDKQELKNIRTHGKHEVDRVAHKLAQERDPNYLRKLADIEELEQKIIAARQASEPQRDQISKLCRHLERQDGNREAMTLPTDKAGNRMTLEQTVRWPELVNALNQRFEQLQKEKGQDRGPQMSR